MTSAAEAVSSGHPGVDRAAPGLGVFLLVLSGLTAVRLVALPFSATDLYFDESQYWAWSRDLAFGYFSKPPLIAWIIAGAEAVCGGAEACLRAPAPLFHAGMAVAVHATASALYGRRAAFWSGLTAALAPGIAYSARIITTDVPLLFFWAVALFAFVRLRAGAGWPSVAVLAVAFGLGLNAKYAMAYFVPGMLVAAMVDERSRALLKSWPLWLGLAGGLLFLLPNLLWNLQNGLVTFAHTGAPVGGTGAAPEIGRALGFLAAQFGIGGPILFGGLLAFAALVRRPSVTADDRAMLAFSAPLFLLVFLAALTVLARVNANWAAPGFVAAFVVVPAMLLRLNRTRLVAFGVWFGLFCQGILLVADASANRVSLPFLRAPDIYAPTLGWRALGASVAARAAETGARSVVAVERRDIASLLYYLRGSDLPVYALPAPSGAAPEHHFQIDRPLGAGAAEPVLAVGTCAAVDSLAEAYRIVVDAGAIEVATGPASTRRHCLRLLSGRAE